MEGMHTGLRADWDKMISWLDSVPYVSLVLGFDFTGGKKEAISFSLPRDSPARFELPV